MGENKTYRDYFAIDKKYYASVTAKLIEEGKVLWKNFYPHETFVKLLEKTHTVLSGKETRSLWVEGAYGTGKSHAALTLKSLLEASDEEVRDYFKDFGLNMDFCEKLVADKNNGKLITIHRIGSASIHSDDDLILAVQESITAALEKHNIKNCGESSLRVSALKWLEKQANKDYLASLIAEEKYAWEFSGKSIDNVMDELKNGNPKQVADLMRSLLKVAKGNGILALRLDAQGMAEWIHTIIVENQLNAILFIWDEFTEFFQNNRNSLTGFQTLVEVGESSPFYFMIVSHESRSLFATDDVAKKILGRFVPPIKIELPENMAFRLMAQAMKKTSDPALSTEWVEYANDLNEQLITVRQVITESTRKSGFGEKTYLHDDDLQRIVPIHPYAALLLKHISVVFSSNQRSMFDFIINNDTDAKGFKWYIDNYGPLDVKNLLTVDMLWNFFYVQGQSGLTDDVRAILDSYNIVQNDKFNEDEKRVFKTILLLQAISQRVGNVALLKPNDQNIDLAFSGTDWAEYKAHSIADRLVKEHVLFNRPSGNRTEYIVALSRNDNGEIEKHKEEIRKEKKTKNLIVDAGLPLVLSLPKAYQNRFDVSAVTVDDDFTKTINTAAQQDWNYKFPVILSFALNENEADKIKVLIEKNVKDEKNQDIIFIDASLSPMSNESYDKYIESMAYSKYYMKSDGKQAEGFNKQAGQCLQAWKTKVENGSFVLYNKDNLSGIRCANLQALVDELKKIDRHVYPYGLEQYMVNEQMFIKGPLVQAAGCGINQELVQQFNSSNKQLSLENVVSGVWHIDDYWKDPMKQSLPIVKAKVKIESMIEEAFKGPGRISVLNMFEMLRKPKFGYMPCSITAFVMGFLLKEYTNGEFFWSNGSTSTPMTVDKMKTLIADGINQVVTMNKKYKEAFLVAMSSEQSAFLQGTSQIFGINPEYCGSIEQARDHIRLEMRKMTFPFWCVKSVLADQQLVTDKKIIKHIIDLYCGIANNANLGDLNESDLANEIGKLFIDNPGLRDDMGTLFKDELTIDGMVEYIKTYRNGELLRLSQDIGDSGSYIDVVKKKFNADAANWVWNTQTAEEKIDNVILEYNIVKESNLSLPKCFSLRESVSEWNKKTNNLKLSYEAVSNMVGDLKGLLEMLHKIKKTTVLQDRDKEQFYELLKVQRPLFDQLYGHQFDYFNQVADSLLVDLRKEEREQVFTDMIPGHFTRSKTEYFQYINGKIKEYIEGQAKMKLKKLWNEKTGTKDPRDWSNKFQTPILCMFDDSKRRDAKRYFGIINNSNPTNADVESAMKYLEKEDFFDTLASQVERDKCFIQRVVGDYSVMLGKPDEIRSYLSEHTDESPYYWIDNQTITHGLVQKADSNYKVEGCERALEVIDKMEIQDLKRYLRELISDNLTVGIEILKNNKE